MNVREILKQHYPSEYVKAYKKGWFDESQSKLYAYGVVLAGADDFSANLHFISGYSYLGVTNDEVFRIYGDDGCFQYKELPQIVEEGIFKWCCIKFYGIFFEGYWFLKKEYMFISPEAENEITPQVQDEIIQGKDFWSQYDFQNVPGYRLEIDYNAINRELSHRYRKNANVFIDQEKFRRYLDETPYDQRPMKTELQYPLYRQFIGQPWLVAYHKEEKKRNVNEAFEKYLKNDFFLSFALALHNKWPDEFYQIEPVIYSGFMQFIYPHSKQYVLGGMIVTRKEGGSRLRCYVFVMSERKFYEWTFHKQRNTSDHITLAMGEAIRNLSSWGTEFVLDDPAITMDDEKFWSEYVFKKEGEKYRYLKLIDVKNPQPDTFTQW
jgi:hypothetical protein